ncbi:hypothetical protein Q5P01_002270 [Channa striata]|uniref:VLIG-type G domain-containing protein n=1 Tax=Channa striata TaxID=64152 RepID=A0AA88NQ28_CHASR|nr:hypothetical protein Q5P01_002270 [Channa striata]
MRIEQMADIAHELGIWVDEESLECQTAKQNADAITTKIEDNLKYKKYQLSLQGQIWKELTNLEKEEFRLRKVGSQNIEMYKSDLQIQKRELRKKQNSYDISNAMMCFIKAISSPGIERCYFLKWMRMNLDNLSREKLSGLREQYKKKCSNSENKEEIKEIDRQLSNSSLGTEHFFREMGQIYEASLSLPETNPSRQQLQHLPRLCAGLMLDGFPLELVDGDASNIPLRWVRDVLSQLNELVSPKNKILVVTVLGVQSTGKSTLLNTMFGVQFAVSSGRCTRGAFMLLLKINEDIRKELNCDFMVIIDTEGLKSPELAQLDDSHEHDNELATLVVGLSDITIINIAMENSTEMKDILQIVVHAFLRMKEVGKKPKCQFVHQNVSDVSAHEKNLRDRKLLLQQLNEMTQAAAKMEKKEDYKSFTDVMEYNPDTGNWYIPGLWNGNPPMAPVNAGYSEAVYELKKNIIQLLGHCCTVFFTALTCNLDYKDMTESVWTMDTSEEEEEFHDAPDTFLELHCQGQGKLHVGAEAVSLGLAPTDPSLRCKLEIDYSSNTQTGIVTREDCSTVDVDGLNPGLSTPSASQGWRKMEIEAKQPLSLSLQPVPPQQVTVSHVSSESVSLQWETPADDVESYTMTCWNDGGIVQELTTNTNCNCASSSVYTKTHTTLGLGTTLPETYLETLLEDLGLKHHYTEKLSLSSILQIDEKIIKDEPAKCNSDLPWCFLKQLMMVNVTARNVKYKCELGSDDASGNLVLDLKSLINCPNQADMLNPLDLITALFLCSDGFVQQEMSLKMSMCQFSVPLLLPNCDTQQCTLMLWAIRDIVKKYRPQSLAESKGFIEDRIVLSEVPMISFVRLGDCSLSKSEILNKLLSNSQQYHDTFVHRNMECGDIPRRISNGLTEITWYLPCGNKNMDVFSEPVAVANLRGDIASFETQYSFLCQTSSAVFVFFDSLHSGCRLLTSQHYKAQIFLVGNQQSRIFNVDDFEKIATELKLTNSNIILKTKRMNDADFVKILRKTMSDLVKNTKMKMRIEETADVAHELGIFVDEDSLECQTAKQNADGITMEIQNTIKFKEAQLPLQGQIWKELTCLEKEECRLRKVGSENIEMYKSKLEVQKGKLRDKQNSYDISNAMMFFIKAISSPGLERCYFLKWMRMNLDNLSREKLSGLREQYKKKCSNSENKEEIKEIDRQLSNSSLGTEHFFREMGQIYEASLSLPETNPSRQQLQHLPRLCAGLMLDGFPLELVDGDASNIPLRWVRDVLSQLNELVSPKNKILVVTVLGVQSTGKSTLLNTMFGVQFAVSSGRCTRGAFMLLLKINEDIRKELKCDFMVIIDTEGLKSPELAQLDDSHEHDNELATLVVGLSDITIINIAMENSTEMKDILQIVVHAFLRMKEVGKKPKCQFVHQNVSDVSAHEKNLRDRKLLLQQLNEMTQAAAKMEKKEDYKSFTDVMEYNPDTGNWYIPGLWNGNPPMAPVNAGYSEAVYELKKNIIQLLGHCKSSNNVMEFTEWMTSLWNAVKHENFIFSFRNSLNSTNGNGNSKNTCTPELHRRKQEVAAKSDKSDIKELLTCLKTEASIVLTEWETKTLKNLTDYFKQTEGHVYLVEGYREEFSNSAKSIRREIERSVLNQLTAAAEIKEGMRELELIKANHTKEIEKAVCALIDECRRKNVQMTEEELDKEFDKMWKKHVSSYLWQNLSHKGSHACELLSQKILQDCGLMPFKYTVEGFYNRAKHKVSKWLKYQDHTMLVQKMADSIIDACTQVEILLMIDEKIQNNQDVDTDIEFEVSLKQHICGLAARNFQKMHEDFLKLNDPDCQKKAEEFTNQYLKPAVKDFINRSLGPDIIGEMLTLQQFSTRIFFQYSILQDLLANDDFDSYLRYICSYKGYVKKWILDQVVSHFSDGSKMFEFEERHLQSSISRINNAINKTKRFNNLKSFVEDICKELDDTLAISQDALGAFMVLNNANEEQFALWLTSSVEDMAQVLRAQFKKSLIEMKLNHLRVKPQNELFNKLIGCGKQCPFCTAPCEAGGAAHTEHWASLHRPNGLGQYRWTHTGKLTTDICSSLVISDINFSCHTTNFEYHPYKCYKEIFPDWKIAPDISLQASDYWKYVMAKFNNHFAKEYCAQPAKIPSTWKKITKKQASASLKESFNIK